MSFYSAASAEGDVLGLSSHDVGDLIILLVYRDGSTGAPTNPGNWTPIASSGSNTNWFGLFWRRALSSVETSGTWANATHLGCWVGRSANYLVPGTATAINGGTTTTLNYTSRTGPDLGGFTSVMLGAMAVRTNNTSSDTAPTGMTRRTSAAGALTGEIAIHDTGSAVASWPLTWFISDNPVGARNTIVVEIRDTGFPIASSGGGLILPRAMNGGYAA